MAYKRKTVDVWSIQGYYSSQYGWEEVTQETSYREGIKQLHCYRKNEPYPFRMRLKREPITPEV